MAAWLRANKRYCVKTGVVVTGWMLGCWLPNTTFVPVYDKLLSTALAYYKDIRSEPECAQLLDEVIADINASRSYRVNKDKLKYRLTTTLHPGLFEFKGSSRLGDSIIALPLGMRTNARDAFYIHCIMGDKEDLENICLLTKEEKKFVYALTIHYTEDNMILFRTLLGAFLITCIAAANAYIRHVAEELGTTFTARKNTTILTKIEFERRVVRKLKRIHNLRNLSFLVLVFGGWMMYRGFTSAFSVSSETNIHKTVAGLGPEYAHGGQQFYLKALAFNLYNTNMGFTSTAEHGEFNSPDHLFVDRLPLSLKKQIYTEKLSSVYS